MKLFAREKMLLQHSFLRYQTDSYFPEHILALEVDEKGHIGRYEKRNRKIRSNKKELRC